MWEFEFVSLGFILLLYYKNCDYVCFFLVNFVQKLVLYDIVDVIVNSCINVCLFYIFLLLCIVYYLKMIQCENIGIIKDWCLLELELNIWVWSLVIEMIDFGDELQVFYLLCDVSVVVEDIEDNLGFFCVKLYVVLYFQVEGMDVNLLLVSQMLKVKVQVWMMMKMECLLWGWGIMVLFQYF